MSITAGVKGQGTLGQGSLRENMWNLKVTFVSGKQNAKCYHKCFVKVYFYCVSLSKSFSGPALS